MTRAARGSARAKVLAAASDMFANQGYTGTTMDDLAEVAGVSKGAIFYHFEGKQELFSALIEDAATSVAETIQGARVGLCGWQALSAVALAVLESIDERPSTAQILVTELFRRGRPWHTDLVALRERLLQPLAEVLAEIADERAAAGKMTAPADAGFDDVAAAVLGALVVAALDRRAFAPDRPLADVHARLMQSLSGLR